MDPDYRLYLLGLLEKDEKAQIAYLLATLTNSRKDPAVIFSAVQIVAEARKMELPINQAELEVILNAISDGEDNHRYLLTLLKLGLN